MALCTHCDKQANKSHSTKPHEFLKKTDDKRLFGGGKRGGFEEQDYQCGVCQARFTHSTDRNDFGWTLWQG